MEGFIIDIDEYFLYIENFRKKNDVNNYVIKNINIWNITRMALFNLSNQDHFKHYSKKTKNFVSWNNIKNLFTIYLKNSDILALTPNIRIKIEDIYGNKFLHWLPENNYKTTYMESPSKNKTMYGNRNEIIIPMERIIFKILINEKIIYRKIKNELYQIINNFQDNDFMIENIDYLTSYISRYISSINFFKRYFKHQRPKIIFTICHYCTINKGAIKAANDLGIPTVDVQHGLINKKSPGYIDKSGILEDTPQYLFVYGKYFKNVISENSNLFKKENIIISGNYYLTKLSNKLKNENSHKKNKKEILLITTQPAIDETAYINIIKEALKINLKVILKIHPAETIEKYKNILNSFSITIKENESIYDLFNVAKYHATVFSTSAIEALFFGVPNIIIPWNGYENQLDFLIDYKTSMFYSKPLKEIITTLKNNISNTNEKGKYFFEVWNQDKIDKFLKNLNINKVKR